MRSLRSLCLAGSVLALSCAITAPALAQRFQAPEFPPPAEVAPVFTEEDETEAQGWDFAGVPAPFADPTLGAGLAGAAGYIFRTDDRSPLSFVGVGGAISNSASGGGGILSSLNFNSGRDQVNFNLGFSRINFDFFGVGFEAGAAGNSIDLQQDYTGGQLEYFHRIHGPISLGVRARYLDVTTRLDDAALALAFPANSADELRQDNAAFSLLARYNTRNDRLKSTAGSYVSATYTFASSDVSGVFDADLSYTKFDIVGTSYRGHGEHGVWVYRAKACSVGGDAPLFDYCLFGVNNDLRGYQAGQYRDRSLLAGQVEYRWLVNDRWTVVGFGGVGAIADNFSEMRTDELLPSIGAGVLVDIWPEYGLIAGIDYAVGRDSDAFYLRFGHAF